MRITRSLLLFLVMALATVSLCYSQNNPYQIDDECYKYMTESDRLIGKPGFDEQTSELKVVNVMVAVLLSVILLGGILGLYIYVRNLRKSQRKDRIMIAELTEANERARAADVAKTQFIQNMTHELRTPLNAISGFSQVLVNLLTNACKHTVRGEIRLGCSLTEVPGMLSFSVEDTGPGIPASEAEHIFERFVKLDSFVQGTGLGLSICRQIAQALGGSVYLDTGYTGGARFVFNIPVSGKTEE